MYSIVYTLMVGSAIGLMIIGMSKSYPIERLLAAGYSARTAMRITGLAALILFPVFNGSGRIVFGWLSDWLGWKPVIVISYFIQSAILISFQWLMSDPVTVCVALVLLAVCYGGNFTIFPIATAQLWGTEHLAANYSLVFLAFGVGALVGPPLSGAAKDAGMIGAVFPAAGVLLALGAILIAVLKKPVKKSRRRQARDRGKVHPCGPLVITETITHCGAGARRNAHHSRESCALHTHSKRAERFEKAGAGNDKAACALDPDGGRCKALLFQKEAEPVAGCSGRHDGAAVPDGEDSH